MIHPIQALSSYIYKYCDNASTRYVNGKAPSHVSPGGVTRSLLEPETVTTEFPEPPPYGEVLPPPAYQSIVGRLCLIDRTDQTFKIYQTDLMMLSREWYRRSESKRDVLHSVVGGPQMAPRRVVIMIDLFMSIVQHQPCPRPDGAPSCECRIKRWACLKQEWQEVMFLLGNQC
ncbi:hypothetical protein MJO28_004066 [Puccinia striiformis f. sp. tritici]|uniref:Uncharacterized protein n=5 Tax=Puccinia striiformis TaxID=27350 RepID=A0A0L0VPT8_9BASI|nr:hypothetical protein Pst134EA_007313 [Puccinia striiformis f. sp. tritici]KAI9617028.1 hypothetical protein H4Q26_010666 [Puccinia striiformis f. sp. tritici PST-130]KNF01294.1 hypothetical protein PSTG_05391 [Puccinia striiformis f. sp. tritici PST-78]POW11994.1 hypothetical protein PSTT_04792 [Puccinia striiformis]KAH9460278.1 hypothetical protein Pst134EB_008458 [Puccinia striiformis f. sp. tritici]KAH9470050.1 hypothetical protein Pst134EA_007313 [Puccinia striiformis f. sp. tritici]